MGTVWSAHDEVLGRLVAIKEVLLPPGIPDAEADALRERSLREARAIAALSHPNVVTLYDVAREGAAPFVVMELVASRSLAELLLDGALPPQRVVSIGAAVAAALQAAHAAGITHRDVKPGNVLVAHDGRIKLTDFGIARNTADQTLTATGLMLGSPAYIAPEIASGGPVNPASDLWGLGATLFAAVEGRPPYDAGTPMATVASVVQDEVPRPSCSGPLAEVISGLMVKDPARRMPLSRVRQLLGAPPEPADPEPVMRPDPVPVATMSAATSALETLETPRRRIGQLAADPGPLPFAVPSDADTPTTAPRVNSAGVQGTGVEAAGIGRRAVLWALAVLLFLGAATAGFAVTRVAAGRPALPYLAARPAVGTMTGDVVLTPRILHVAEPDGTRPARFTVSVPQGWPEFREQRALGNNSGTVMRFVSPDGSEVISVERVTGVQPGGDLIAGSAGGDPIAGSAGGDPIAGSAGGVPDRYLTTYLRRLAQEVPELVETQRQRLSGGALEATFRTQEGGGVRRTTYLRLVPARADLWVVSVTVPTEREGAGRTKLFEPVVAAFAPGL
ncbi:MAG: serine/threonine protein kinase [Actinomycetota bacterium]|nr:serine/threonine protein kinase [Actinomycetota bacterium]